MKFNINAPSVLLPYHKLDKTRNSNSIESSGVYMPCDNSVRIEKDKVNAVARIASTLMSRECPDSKPFLATLIR
ncbi:hypothetical protein T09_15404 [Trichinella sp. T9]|nr:hypothetical protein T09_15404 [Trichinella sp. T9]